MIHKYRRFEYLTAPVVRRILDVLADAAVDGCAAEVPCRNALVTYAPFLDAVLVAPADGRDAVVVAAEWPPTGPPVGYRVRPPLRTDTARPGALIPSTTSNECWSRTAGGVGTGETIPDAAGGDLDRDETAAG